jgi:hypothetical protein
MGQARFIRRNGTSDFPRNPSIDGQFHGHAEHRPEGAEQISLGQSDAARAASDAPGGESTNLQALKGRNRRPASPVSPFQGWYVPGSAYPGRRSRVHPLHSAPGWHVPPRWGKEPPCALVPDEPNFHGRRNGVNSVLRWPHHGVTTPFFRIRLAYKAVSLVATTA